MSTRRILFGFLVCFSISVFGGKTLSQTRGTTRERSERGRLRNMDRQQRQQVLERNKLKQQMIEGQLEKQIGPAKSEKELMKKILRATEKQWQAIKPTLDKVRVLRSLANVSIEIRCIGIGSGGIGGSSAAVKSGVGRMSGFKSGSMSGGWGGGGEIVRKQGSAGGSSSTTRIYSLIRPSKHRGFENLNEGEKICEELFRLLEDNNSELEQIRQKMEALRKFRQEANKELAIAQQELRQLVTPHQEAALVMMQLLD